MENFKTGLVMEGGGMRGMFTAGAIDVLMENGIIFEGAIGVSAGATFGCNYKSKQIGRAIRYNKKYSHHPKYGSFSNLFKTGNLYDPEFCYDILPHKLDVFDLETYKKNPMEFYVVVSDCVSGNPIYKKLETCDKNELTWMRASASIPLVSKVVEVDGYKLLDGGMTDSIPLQYFESLGYNRNIVILTQTRSFVKKPTKMIGLMKFMLHKYPKVVESMKNRPKRYNSEKKYVFEKESKGEVIVICPPENFKMNRLEHNPQKLQACYEAGRQSALEKIDEIKNFLNQKSI
ncbi:MAG: patatin family protein [Treponema sp.]|nr:patatin family protein [Treponema sp.]